MKQSTRFTSKGLLSTAMLLIVFSTAVLMAQARPQATAQTGMSAASVSREVVLSDLPKMTPADFAAIKEPPEPRNPHFTNAEYLAAKDAASRAAVGSRPQDAARLLVPVNPNANVASQTPGAFVDFLAQSEGCNGLAWRPSDMGLAVNSLYIVQVVNECLSVYNKTGGLLLGPVDLCTFMGRTPNSGAAGCFDPRAIYDFQANKFIIISDYVDASGNGNIDIANSKTNNPTGLWNIHHLPRGAGFTDYPTLGQTAFKNNVNNSVITVCDNFFGSSFYAECLLLPKKKVYASLGFSYPFFFGFSLGGLILDTLQPANAYETEENPRAQYAVNAVNYNGTDGFCAGGASKGLVLWSFSDASGSQGAKVSGLWTGCNTSGYNFPGAADDGSFCTSCIDTIDNRIKSMVHYSSGRIFPSLDANNGGTSAVLGWVVRPFLNVNGGGCTGSVTCPTLSGATIEQEFCYDCGGGHTVEAYDGDVGPTPENDWVLFATFSSGGSAFNISPEQFYASNRVSATPFVDSGIVSCGNFASYNQFRWGDYSAAAPDIPGTASNPAVWGSGMYVQANGNWGTCIAGVRPQGVNNVP